jgi:type IV secretion system protein VirB4
MRNPFLSASGWSERSADDYLPFVGHVRDNAVLKTDGSVMGILRLRGAPFALEDHSRRNSRHRFRNAVLRNIADDVLTGVPPLPAGAYRSAFAADLENAYRREVLAGRERINEWFVSVIVHPRAPVTRGLNALRSRTGRKKEAASTTASDELARTLDDRMLVLAKAYAEMQPVRLGIREAGGVLFSEIAEALRLFITARFLPVPVVSGSLGGSIYTDRVICGRRGFEVRSPGRPSFGTIMAEFPRQGGYAGPDDYRRRVARYEAVVEPLARMFGVLGRWGDDAGHRLASEILASVAASKTEGGLNLWLDLRFYPAVLLFHAYGLGALQAGRHAVLFQWITQSTRVEARDPAPFIRHLAEWRSTTFDRWKMLEGFDRRKTPLSDHLHEITPPWTADYVVTEDDHTLLFESFEVLCSLAFLTACTTKKALQTAQALDEDDKNYIWSPQGRASWDSQIRDRILADLERPEFFEPLLQVGFAKGDADWLKSAIVSMRRLMSRLEWR